MSPAIQCHPTAVVEEGAEFAEGVVIGPYAIVRKNVRLGSGTLVGAHAVVDEYTTLGSECVVFSHACVGTIPQDLKFHGERSYLEAGDRNVFREFVTVNRGTEGGGGITRIGSDNLFMAYCHIAHDCIIGDHVIFGNAATLAGHVVIEDWANVGAFSGFQQFCRVGQHAFIAAYSGVTKDVVPYAKVQGMHAKSYGVNTIGLKRRGFTGATVAELKRAFRILFRKSLNTTQALKAIAAERFTSAEVATLVDFVRSSKHGIVK
ncbi:MAG: acyl-ACP--UDP-N-acetylglucosamine O-acyltransferase [Acidobacteriota bacterium]